MPASIDICILFEPILEVEPFTQGAVVWSFVEDIELKYSQDSCLCNGLGIDIKNIGLIDRKESVDFFPDNSTYYYMADEEFCGWVQASSFLESVDKQGKQQPPSDIVRAFVGAVRSLVDVYGVNRVRIVFAVVP